MKAEQVDKMSLQEACDYAVKQIVNQGTRCLSRTNICCYGNDKGQHCAIGWLLDETDDMIMISNGSITSMVEVHGPKIPNLIANNIELFGCLQGFHDASFNTSRHHIAGDLQHYYNIDTSGDHWSKWINMGLVDA